MIESTDITKSAKTGDNAVVTTSPVEATSSLEATEIARVGDNVLVTTSPVEATFQQLPFATVAEKVKPLKNKGPPPIEFGEADSVTDWDKHVSKFRYLQATAYRRIFCFIMSVNTAALIGLMVVEKGRPSVLSYNTATSANIAACILSRQENVVNLLYEICCCVPHSWPLQIRKRLARIYHYGGIHSGCGMAASMWFLLQSILVTLEYIKNWRSTLWLLNLISSWFIVLMLVIIRYSAFPAFRRQFHNHFEAMHRYAGWSGLIVFWIHLFLVILLEQEKDKRNGFQHEDFGLLLIKIPSFWLLLVSTSCGLVSWGRLRRREVLAETLGEGSIGHAIRLHFKYYDMPPFYGVKVSTDPLREWHSFATIPDKRGGFSILVSNAGDWTNEIVNNPPKSLWVRGRPLHGLAYTSRIFKQIVVVATGSGIGPMLSLFASHVVPARVLWSTPNPLKTFGQDIIDDVYAADKNAVVWNTREHGRPDLVRLTMGLVKECEAEAVYVISNKPVTSMLVVELQARGVNVVGVIWDS